MTRYLGDSADLLLPGKLRGVCRDPNDDLILECAVVNGAKFIVTGDIDLLVLHPYAGIKIPCPHVNTWIFLGLP